MTALPLAGWRSFRLASSPGDPPRVLVGTSPEGREVSLGEALDHGHGVWSCVLLGSDGELLMEEDCLSERRGLEKLYGWTQYLSGGGSWETSSRERAIGTVPGGVEGTTHRPHGEGVGQPSLATEKAGSIPAPGTARRKGPTPRRAYTRLGRAIQEAREAKGWSQSELARRIAPDRAESALAIVSALEGGRLKRSPLYLSRIAAELGCDLDPGAKPIRPRQAPAAPGLGERLRRAGEAKGWSLRILAQQITPEEEMGRSIASTCSKLERGLSSESAYLPAILRVLGLEAE